tara:strand:+ start:1484 stop:1711 length:228 start_codon:yes stop_codon:yes gene_type:complete
MMIKLNDTIYSGSATEIVALMKNTSIFTQGEAKCDYMEAVRDRIDALTGERIRTATCRMFVADICSTGMATKITK